MSDFGKNMRLKEKAEEDMYFARRDRELIRGLREKESVNNPKHSAEERDHKSGKPQEDASVETSARYYDPGIIARYLRRLTGKVLKRCSSWRA